MYSEEMIRQRFQEICDDFEGDLKYPEERAQVLWKLLEEADRDTREIFQGMLSELGNNDPQMKRDKPGGPGCNVSPHPGANINISNQKTNNNKGDKNE